jgi:hypothetical protein
MLDQMDIFEGQKDPLLLKWATKESGNPFAFTDEEEKAKYEIRQLKMRKRILENKPEKKVSNKRSAKQAEKEQH